MQPDTIIPDPYDPQSWNRFSYVYNNPVNFIDPSGHRTCDDEYGCAGANNDSGSGLTHSNTGVEDMPGCGVLGNEPYGFHCTVDDLDNATLQQRLDWFDWLVANMNANIEPETSNWFRNIRTIVAGFIATGQDDNAWVMTVDANILVAVQDGYVASLDLYTGSPIAPGSGADLWRIFFLALSNPSVNDDTLIQYWGQAEQAGTNEGMNRAAKLGYGGKWTGDWIITPRGFDDSFFTLVGNLYRSAGRGWCNGWSPWKTCVGGFYDPRTLWLPGFSPVGYVELPIYFFDTFGSAFTGH